MNPYSKDFELSVSRNGSECSVSVLTCNGVVLSDWAVRQFDIS